MTSVSHECAQWQDERAALSSTLTSDVNESEHVDDKGMDDVLCDLPSRHGNVVSSRMFVDDVSLLNEVVGVPKIDDAKTSLDQVTDSSSRRKHTVVEKFHVCNERHKAFKTEQMKRECTDAIERPYVCDECAQWQDERTALSSTLTSDANESEHVDDKGEDDVLYDMPSRHLDNVSSRMFGDAVEVVGMSQIYDTKAQNLLDKITDSSRRRKNTVAEKSHLCNERHKTYKTEQMKHRCIDAVERPYVCDICTEVFMTSSVLTSHRQTHTGDTCRKCDVRQKIFAHLLKKNKLAHTDEKPYQCDMCRKKCTELSSSSVSISDLRLERSNLKTYAYRRT